MQRTAVLTSLLILASLLIPCQGTSAERETLGDIQYLRLSPDQPLLSPGEALAREDWNPLPGKTPNFGYTRDVFWYRAGVPEADGRRILEISYPHLDDIRFWPLANGKPVERFHTGDRLPFQQRPLRHSNFLFPWELRGEAENGILLRVQTRGAHHVPLELWRPRELLPQLSREDQLHSLYYGILITISLFSLMVFLGLREKIYLYYLFTTVSFLLLLASLRGITYPLLWPASPALQNYSILVAIPLAVLSMVLFSRKFLQLNRLRNWADHCLRAALAINLVSLAGIFLLDYNLSIWLSVSVGLITCLLLAIIGPVLWIRGHPQAGIYTLAWGALTIGGLATGANAYGLLPNSFATTYGIQLGSTIQALVLTMALANRVYRERESRVRSQQAELAALSAQRRAEHRVMDQAMRDPLTQLPNRTCFEVNAAECLSLSPGKRWAICVVRLENLAAITKTLGHRNSDRLLELVSLRMNQIAASLPGIQRIGAQDRDCLAVLEPATFAYLLDARQAAQASSRVTDSIEQLREPIDYLGMQLSLDSCVGVALCPDHSTDLNTLVRQAYVAQESSAAREKGIAYYKPAKDPYSPERLTQVTDLKHALHEGELALWYQPKLSLRDGRMVGVEALIRWPGRQPAIRADQLIQLAEQSGLIRPITRWVMEQALAARALLLEAGLDLTVSINISPNNLREKDFPLFVQRLMTSHHQHRGRLILEVTETSMMQDPANSMRTLRSLDYAGIPLAIDDFGSGYSSLSYIKQLPACEVKIDRSLITDLRTHPDDRIIVKTTIDMCHSLGYQVVAEGVEDEETIELLREMGCDMIQGYVLARPQPLGDLIRQLTDQQTDTPAGTTG
ncbi:diguanylate cyclase/phosphodiesterase [Marinobacter daqiaonensis]|uniref:Diguanylate cyclase/phosphodiesterase n=1 Tax=Marinobacter daqiaonensis TaxID=650891 RepID=A0A1I6JSX2_9GAMM|nr:EAL domain-containing protein [Marinobacter daqiaonensis]SFR81640.1 diguanylate cyclase/phosphodiesterase [Marinobacter daqiaonensis]